METPDPTGFVNDSVDKDTKAQNAPAQGTSTTQIEDAFRSTDSVETEIAKKIVKEVEVEVAKEVETEVAKEVEQEIAKTVDETTAKEVAKKVEEVVAKKVEEAVAKKVEEKVEAKVEEKVLKKVAEVDVLQSNTMKEINPTVVSTKYPGVCVGFFEEGDRKVFAVCTKTMENKCPVNLNGNGSKCIVLNPMDMSVSDGTTMTSFA